MVKNKNKTSPFSSPRWVVFAGAVVAAVLALGASAWLLPSARQQIKQRYYTYQAKAAFRRETQALDPSLSALGFKAQDVGAVQCQDVMIYNEPKPHYECMLGHENYVVAGTDATKQAAIAQAKQLDAVLQKQGWVISSNSAPNVSQWFQDVLGGKDWYTGIGGYKNSGNRHCSINIGVAYSNPKPPAYVVRVGCTAPVANAVKDKTIF